MQRFQELKNKKGFSLVELIIVIAIMAVLVGILAPQFTRYIERSRVSADVQVANGIASTLKTIAIDPMLDANLPSTSITATWASNGATGPAAITLTADGAVTAVHADISTAFNQMFNATATPRSRSARTANVVVIITLTTGNITVNHASFAGDHAAFGTALRAIEG